jgi:hypothetical protein
MESAAPVAAAAAATLAAYDKSEYPMYSFEHSTSKRGKCLFCKTGMVKDNIRVSIIQYKSMRSKDDQPKQGTEK